MHEMSIAASLLELAKEEARRRECSRISKIRVEYGAISGVMPEALRFCLMALCAGTENEEMELELVKIPLRLRCPLCNHVFGGETKEAQWQPCPACGEIFGHTVEQGTELVLARLEAYRD